MSVDDNSYNSNNNNGSEENNTITNEDEKIKNDFATIYEHDNGVLSLIPGYNPEEPIKKHKKNNKTETEHSIVMNSLETI
ncbi:hypothetical protein [Clostridium magnum]|uniref:Uncharacterized protein n=1 Tax=Clostridium magnum DSM 2767 TaxID=1121326 RepID=A0A162U6F6_9CLOT|nr:hypothetical protein [Clostridium magnum]KZL93593.1 hypothetical protein CLMAG_06390 [Clostridium magnum DSM 2767]SHI58769.1 hypothetical protein SAMN02745944_04537 [Clostridium magnum DSM 2767]